MKKSDIEFHSDGYGSRNARPAVNVKVSRCGLDSDALVAQFNCTKQDAERALQYAFESAQSNFWEQAQERVSELFPHDKATVYTEGRSGGWLVVHGLPDVSTWDAPMVGKWAALVKWCREEIAYRTAKEQMLDDITANEWLKAGAELYNFRDTPRGVECVADIKAFNAKAPDALRTIHALFDGKEVDSDTLGQVAEVLTAAGLTVRNPL